MPTLEITNLGGPLTRKNTGDINSGLAKYDTSWGYDPYSKPGNLTWLEQPTSILSGVGGDANGVVVAMKTRPQSGTFGEYTVRAISSGRSLYRIQVNNDTTKNPDLDSASVVGTSLPGATLTDNANMVFYGNPLKIFYLGNAVGKVNFDGSSPASIASASVVSGSRGLTTFLGKIYFGNGNNIGEIDSTELLVTERKLSPALPENVIVKDLDVTPDGNYLQLTTSELDEQVALNGGTTNAGTAGVVDSHKFLWNGIDGGATAYERNKSVNLTANESFGSNNYSFGDDQFGTAIFAGSTKILSLPRVNSPNPNATFSGGNLLSFCTTEYDEANTRLTASLFNFGKNDSESPEGLFRLFRQPAQIENDVVSVPTALYVSNITYTPSIFAYANNISGRSKVYYSTVEEDAGATSIDFKLWRFETVPTGAGSVLLGTYETQNQLFSKKVKPGEIRFYTEPLVANNSFSLNLLNSGSSIIASNTYTVGTNVTSGDDLIRFKPEIAPTQAVGFRINNLGSANWTGLKLEMDYENAGS